MAALGVLGGLPFRARLSRQPWMSMGQAGSFTGAMNAMRSYSLYGDDKGETWKRGEMVLAYNNENQLAELVDGCDSDGPAPGPGANTVGRW